MKSKIGNDTLSQHLVDAVKTVVGSLGEYVHVPYVPDGQSLMAFTATGYYHVHGASFCLPKYVDPILLTSASGAWATTGNLTEVIAAGAIAKDFDLHWITVEDISTSLYGIIDIYAGPADAPVLIGAVDVARTSNFSREGAMPVQVPQQPAGTRISCKFSDNTAGQQTCRVKFLGHVYSISLT